MGAFLDRLFSQAYSHKLRPHHGSIVAPGTLKNFNTIEEFKAADKNALFNQEAQLVSDQSLLSDLSNVRMLDLGSHPRNPRCLTTESILCYHVRRSQEVQVLLLVCISRLCRKTGMGYWR